MDLTKEIKSCVKLLRENGATEIFLFGSQARGDATSRSDLDFAVRGIAKSQLFRLLVDLETVAHKSVDLVLLDSKNTFSRHIESKISNGWAIHVG